MTSSRNELAISIERQQGLKYFPTFHDNKELPIHSWFSYTEGFSGKFVKEAISNALLSHGLILDPFCGSSTTGVESLFQGHNFHGYDINPVMTMVSEAKTICAFAIAKAFHSGKTNKQNLISIAKEIYSTKISKKKSEDEIFSDKEYFSSENLKAIRAMRSAIDQVENEDIRTIMLVGLLSILVKVSYLKRSPDLKYRAEKDFARPSARTEFFNATSQFIEDVFAVPFQKYGQSKIYTGSAKKLQFTKDNSVDLIVTSPPYLNGTNYIRNTKLELWIGGFMKKDSDLKNFRCSEISSGINSAQKTTYASTLWPKINKTIEEIKGSQYDSRISPMVANYFHDMHSVFIQLNRVMKPKSKCYLVIGDSAFNGVHIPTDKHLILIGEHIGLHVIDTVTMRKRKSRGGMPLTEELLIFQKG